ncbi:hypothetical protein C1645_840277 [Glomus cerebriforme]|uniref:Galactose oxidase n=1 Tax=Glomus cerebriforme TaxID=658196 RepID=A0A397S4G2_9GLOM|nr:hypothetical protein C1645_840277 [Glomus cerebriforme]
MKPFKPNLLYKHTATLIDNKLYILGGSDGKYIIEKNFFYLDVSVPFSTQNLLWKDLSIIDILPPHEYATSIIGGTNNDTLFLYGGITYDQTMALVYTFDSKSDSWSIPKITGVNTIRKTTLTGINHDGKMYLWSGCDNKVLDSCVFVNDMLILDTINLSWGKGSLVNAPTQRRNYGATLLSNNNIIYMGGIDTITYISYNTKSLIITQGSALTLSEVYLYDTINDNWSTKMTSGRIPSNRAGFSTVLGLDGQRIIIFGGVFVYPGYLDTTLYVLDLTNFSWYIPNVSGKIPSPRFRHQANVIGKYMVISFGSGYDKSIESDILLLDISNNNEYVWTTTFDPSVPNNIISTTSPSPSPSPSISSSSPSLPSLSSSSQPTNNNYSWCNYVITIHGNEGYNNHNQEGILTSAERDIGQKSMLTMLRNLVTNKTSRNETMAIPAPVINKNNNYEQENIQIPKYENSTNHESVTPTPVINRNNNYGQEIIQTHRDENTIKYEPIIPASVVNRNYDQGQEVISTYNDNRLSLQVFKDEIFQAVKQENQNLKNEIIQVVTRQENYDVIRNNGR